MFAVPQAPILHADVDAFFASVEQRDDPCLRGRPVIVGLGVVLAASYEAKAHGVDTAMGGARARRLCPQAVVVQPRMSAYADASKALFRVFEDTTPMVEGLSIDEAFLDVRGMRRLSGTAVEIATRLRVGTVGLVRGSGTGETTDVARFVHEHRVPLRIAVVSLGVLVLVVRSHPGPFAVIVVGILVVIGLLLLEFLGRSASARSG